MFHKIWDLVECAKTSHQPSNQYLLAKRLISTINWIPKQFRNQINDVFAQMPTLITSVTTSSHLMAKAAHKSGIWFHSYIQMQSPISINYSHKVSQANTKLKTSQPTKFQQFNQISKFIFNSVVKKWRWLCHGRLRWWISHRLPFYGHRMVDFTWWLLFM